MYKQYIRLDDKNNVVYGFSDVFGEPAETDIEHGSPKEGHFYLFDEYNPTLTNMLDIYLYKYMNETVVKKTDEEIQKEISGRPIPIPIPSNVEIQQEVKNLEETVTQHGEILNEILPPNQPVEEVANE